MRYIFVLLLFAPAFLDAQTYTLRGFVTEQNSGRRPVAGAEVRASLANSTRANDSDGSFALEFVGKKEGYQVQLRVSKPGMEVVNERELFHTLTANRILPIRIYMCPEGQWEENALTFYNINKEKITARYKRTITRLRANITNQRVLEDSLNLFGDRYRVALAQAEELAEKFAKANLDFASEMFRQAYAFYSRGEVDSALLVLNEAELDRAARELLEEEAEGKELIQQGTEKLANADSARDATVEGYTLRARLLSQQFDVEDAMRNFEKAIALDSTNFDLLWEFGDYLAEQNKTTQALGIYQSAFPHAPSLFDSIDILNNRGNAYLQLNRYDLALADYERVVAIRETLAAQEPARFLPDLAKSLSNRGNAYINHNQYDLAIADYDRTIALFAKLAFHQPALFLPDLAKSLANRGMVYSDRTLYDLALADYDRAITMYDTLAKQEPARFLPGLAHGLIHRGTAYSNSHQHDLAIADHDRAVTIFDTLSRREPSRFLHDLAASLVHRGTAYCNSPTTRFNLVIADYNRAISIYSRLVTQEPARFLPDLAMSLNNRGFLLGDMENFESAFLDLERALAIMDTLLLANPEVYCASRVQALLALFLTHLQHAQSGGGEAAVNKMLFYLDEAARSVKLCPQTPQVESLSQIIEEYKSQLESLNDPFAELRRAVSNARDPQEKTRLQRRLVEEMAAQSASAADLASEYGNLAWYRFFARNFAEAETAARRGIELDPEGGAWIHTNLALALLYQGKFKQAKALYARFKGQPFPQSPSASWTDIFREDLNALEAEGITHPDVARIRAFLAE